MKLIDKVMISTGAFFLIVCGVVALVIVLQRM